MQEPDEILATPPLTVIEGNAKSLGLCPNFYVFLVMFLFNTLFFLLIWRYWPPEVSCTDFLARVHKSTCEFIVRVRLCLGSHIHPDISRLDDQELS